MRDKPYCNAPWLGLYYEGTVGCRPCCEWKGDTFEGNIKEYENSQFLTNFKKMMYADNESSFCQECIHNEKVGGHSRRKYYEKWDNYVDYETPGLNRIIRLDYRAGNKCNMMCRMCGPQSSSLLEEEIIEAGEQKIGFTKHLDTSDVYGLDLNGCEEISILGGEPSIDLAVRKFMNYVADNYSNIKIVVTTNATNASDKWIKTLMKFCSGAGLQVILSVDAAGATQDFQRKSKIGWNTIKKNMLVYKKISDDPTTNCGVSIQCTATAINMVTLDTWWNELLGIGIPVIVNQVWWPKGMAVSSIPNDLKQKSIKYLENYIKELPEPVNKLPTRNKYETTEQTIRILRDTEYSGHAQKEFVALQNRYDNYRSENVRDLDDRFKVMMI
jgi:MoaA/NifB/PqqE/SkfB family radical SAM enzyme